MSPIFRQCYAYMNMHIARRPTLPVRSYDSSAASFEFQLLVMVTIIEPGATIKFSGPFQGVEGSCLLPSLLPLTE
jgi:hypothetical protein